MMLCKALLIRHGITFSTLAAFSLSVFTGKVSSQAATGQIDQGPGPQASPSGYRWARSYEVGVIAIRSGLSVGSHCHWNGVKL